MTFGAEVDEEPKPKKKTAKKSSKKKKTKKVGSRSATSSHKINKIDMTESDGEFSKVSEGEFKQFEEEDP